jgi:hypothetical protein
MNPTEKHDGSPLSAGVNNILLNASITKTKSKGDKGSPVSGYNSH